MRVIIPKKENLAPLSYEYIDSTIDQYYRPVQGYFMRKRLDLAFSLLGEKKVDTILDVGYGGGTFIPALAQLSDHVYGIDTFPHPERVMELLEKEGVRAHLFNASVFEMPFKENFFDRVVCVSVLEHFRGQELNTAIREMVRVLKPGGFLVMGFPVKNPVTDFIIKYILHFEPNDIHPSSHTQIIHAIQEEAAIDALVHYFPWVPLNFSLYCVVRVKK